MKTEKVKVKELRIIITGTDRKRKALERRVRDAIDNFEDAAGVDKVRIYEVNRVEEVMRGGE